MVKISAEITEKTSKWKNFNVEIAVDEYNRKDQEIKDLEEETSLLEVELDRLRMELKGIKKKLAVLYLV
jgi:predicted nuclease with TOPRIM domain